MAVILTANRNIYHNGRGPLLRECDGGNDDLCVDPDVRESGEEVPTVQNPEAAAALGWPGGRPPEHPEVSAMLSLPWMADVVEEATGMFYLLVLLSCFPRYFPYDLDDGAGRL